MRIFLTHLLLLISKLILDSSVIKETTEATTETVKYYNVEKCIETKLFEDCCTFENEIGNTIIQADCTANKILKIFLEFEQFYEKTSDDVQYMEPNYLQEANEYILQSVRKRRQVNDFRESNPNAGPVAAKQIIRQNRNQLHIPNYVENFPVNIEAAAEMVDYVNVAPVIVEENNDQMESYEIRPVPSIINYDNVAPVDDVELIPISLESIEKEPVYTIYNIQPSQNQQEIRPLVYSNEETIPAQSFTQQNINSAPQSINYIETVKPVEFNNYYEVNKEMYNEQQQTYPVRGTTNFAPSIFNYNNSYIIPNENVPNSNGFNQQIEPIVYNQKVPTGPENLNNMPNGNAEEINQFRPVIQDASSSYGQSNQAENRNIYETPQQSIPNSYQNSDGIINLPEHQIVTNIKETPPINYENSNGMETNQNFAVPFEETSPGTNMDYTNKANINQMRNLYDETTTTGDHTQKQKEGHHEVIRPSEIRNTNENIKTNPSHESELYRNDKSNIIEQTTNNSKANSLVEAEVEDTTPSFTNVDESEMLNLKGKPQEQETTINNDSSIVNTELLQKTTPADEAAKSINNDVQRNSFLTTDAAGNLKIVNSREFQKTKANQFQTANVDLQTSQHSTINSNFNQQPCQIIGAPYPFTQQMPFSYDANQGTRFAQLFPMPIQKSNPYMVSPYNFIQPNYVYQPLNSPYPMGYSAFYNGMQNYIPSVPATSTLQAVGSNGQYYVCNPIAPPANNILNTPGVEIRDNSIHNLQDLLDGSVTFQEIK